MNIATYSRVSTTEQTIQPQVMELKKFADAKGWTITHKFSDVISGRKVQRDGLDELLELVRDKGVDGVMVVKIDRLARSLTHFAQIIDVLRKSGVALIVPGQGIDTSNSNPAGRMMMNMLGVIADFERDLISERTKAGLVAAKARGKVLGKPSTRMVANSEVVVRTWRTETGGLDFRLLAERLGGVSTATAWRVAKAAE